MNPRLCVVAVLVALVLAVTPAAAHPLGNFTINHLTKISVARDRVGVRYVLDQAEIPTFSLLRTLDANGNVSQAELNSWASEQAPLTARDLTLVVAGQRQPLAVLRASARLRPGAGHLPTLYFVADYAARVAAIGKRVSFADGTFAGRIGWKDVVVVPEREPTHELRAYPNALLGSPRDLTQTSFVFGGDGRVRETGPVDPAPAGGPSFDRSNPLSDLLTRDSLDPSIIALTFLVAIALGALHALEPGHGKTLLAVSLVGARATAGQALILAGALTFAHTIGVIVLGAVVLFAARWIVPESIYPAITLLSGIAIAVLGARALQRYAATHLPCLQDHDHDHAHDRAYDHSLGHAHSHSLDHSHAHAADDEAHARAHLVPGDAPLGFSSVVVAAMSGGVAPCPAALVVLLTAISVHRIEYGLALIVAFSLGLAAVLTGLGLAVVRGARWLASQPRFERVARYGPLLSAAVISAIGAVMVGQGFAAQGSPVSPLLSGVLVLCAIAGYVLTPAHRHAHHHSDAVSNA